MSVFSNQASALTLPTAFQNNEPSSPSSPSPPPPKKLLNVTFTILSMSGVHAKESNKKKKSSYRSKFTLGKFWQDDETAAGDESTVGNPARPTTTIVASLERIEQNTIQAAADNNNGENTKTIVTHIPSLPLSLPPPSPSSSRNSKTKMFNDVVYWPEQNDGSHSKISSFTFSRHFPHEEMKKNNDGENNNESNSRYVPQMCPIQISISRNGKMYKLGHAHVFVSGEEKGETSVNVPVVNFEQAFGSRGITGRNNSNSGGCNLMRLKDDTLKCGLAERATLRLLVTVSDPLMPRIQVNYVLSTREIREQLRLEEEESLKKKNHIQVDTASGMVSIKEEDTLLGTRHEELVAASDEVTAKTPTADNLSTMASLARDRSTAGISVNRESSNASSGANSSRFGPRQSSKFSRDVSYLDSLTNGETFTDDEGFTDEEDFTLDDSSTDSESSSEEELLKLIRDISKKGLLSSKDNAKKKDSDSTVCSSLATESTDNSTRVSESDSIDSPPVVKRMSAFPGGLMMRYPDCGNGGSSSSRSAGASSLMKSWTRRMVCCAGSVGGINIVGGGSNQDDESTLLASINEEDNSLMTFDEKGTYYSLEGREHSLETLETDNTPW